LSGLGRFAGVDIAAPQARGLSPWPTSPNIQLSLMSENRGIGARPFRPKSSIVRRARRCVVPSRQMTARPSRQPRLPPHIDPEIAESMNAAMPNLRPVIAFKVGLRGRCIGSRLSDVQI
jgi:hypothetical protein